MAWGTSIQETATSHRTTTVPTNVAACVPALAEATTTTNPAHAAALLNPVGGGGSTMTTTAAASAVTTSPPTAAPLSEEVAGAADHLEEFGVDLLISFTQHIY